MKDGVLSFGMKERRFLADAFLARRISSLYFVIYIVNPAR